MCACVCVCVCVHARALNLSEPYTIELLAVTCVRTYIRMYIRLAHLQTGVLRFYGNVKFEAGLWAGVELDEPVGRHSGSVSGVQYFKCRPKHGEWWGVGWECVGCEVGGSVLGGSGWVYGMGEG